MADKKIGKITRYYSAIGVVAIKLSAPLKVGDKIKIKGHTTDFEQKIDSMQIEHESIEKAKKGDEVGLKVKDKVRPGDLVYLSK